ncbi:hypothetical protein T484DRAFT_2020020 [Baffinella frigidus]|nr:hypothetical protein T484DRAFT_2020020 [Cryptophyta sp. CCMP2293]
MAKRCHADDPASARRTARRRGPTLAEACIKLSACTDEDRDSAAARRVIEVMLEEEPPRRTRDSFACLAATTDAPARELSLLRLDEARRRGVAVLFELATEFRVDTCSEIFALGVALLDRCITTPKLPTLQRECYELPMVCFLLALKFSDGCPPLLDHLCLALVGIEADPRAVAALEGAVLEALQWKIDTVTVTHLLLQAFQLLPAGQRDTWRASMTEHVDIFHAQCMTTDFRASTAAAAIIGNLAHSAGLTEACLAPWLPAALTPPLDALLRAEADTGVAGAGIVGRAGNVGVAGAVSEGGGVGAVSAMQGETLACMHELRHALPEGGGTQDAVREASLSPPFGLRASRSVVSEWAPSARER